MMEIGDSIMLLHASDFHVRDTEGEPLLHAHDIRELFIFDAEQLVKKVGPPTALIFSGDIAFSGKATEYDVAREMFTKILQRLNLKEQRILVVPGNHDVDRKKAAGLEARMIRDRLRAEDDTVAENIFVQKREDLLAPLLDFQEFAMPYDCLIRGENGYWEIDNINNSSASEYLTSNFQIKIRGISTVHVSDRNDGQMIDLESPDDGSHMYIAQGQLTCDPTTSDGPFRVLVGHHPPSWWRFSENRKILADARYHLHLFGHEHKFAPHPTGNAVCVKAGAVNPDHVEDQARYNWIKITQEKFGYIVRIWSRVFDNTRHEFTEDCKWPGGQGYKISHSLDVAPELISPERTDETQHTATSVDLLDIVTKVQSHKEPSAPHQPTPHAVRFALLSQNHQKYSLVFSGLGHTPNADQMNTLGGLEYYEDMLKKLLLPENISKLIEAMEKEGISVF